MNVFARWLITLHFPFSSSPFPLFRGFGISRPLQFKNAPFPVLWLPQRRKMDGWPCGAEWRECASPLPPHPIPMTPLTLAVAHISLFPQANSPPLSFPHFFAISRFFLALKAIQGIFERPPPPFPLIIPMGFCIWPHKLAVHWFISFFSKSIQLNSIIFDLFIKTKLFFIIIGVMVPFPRGIMALY